MCELRAEQSGKQDPRENRKGPGRQPGARGSHLFSSGSRFGWQWPFPSEKPSSEVIHHKAFHRKGRKTGKARRRHLEDLAPLHDRENIMPFGGSPEVPKLPKPATHPAGNEKGEETPPLPRSQIAFQGRQSQAKVD